MIGSSPRVALAVSLMLALPGLARAVTTTQTDVRTRMERAVALLAAEEVDRAIPVLLSIVGEAPHHGPARFQLGALAVERGEWEVAVTHLETAVASYGPDAPAGAAPVQRPGLAWALYADALGRTGRLEAALEATSRALNLAPEYVPALLGRSDVARRLARDRAGEAAERLLETALDAARRARGLAPDRPGPWISLALAADEAPAPELSRCAAGRAVELAPDDAQALFLVAWTSADHDPAAALAAAEGALAAGRREDPALWMTLGRLRAFRMDMAGALAAYREALRLDPAVTGEMASPALDAITAAGDPELMELLRERAARRADAVNTRFALAKAALREGRLETAARELRRLGDQQPGHAAILTALHAALRRTGDDAGANRALARLDAVKAAEAEAWERANRNEERRRRARKATADRDYGKAVEHWRTVAGGFDGAGPAPPELAADLAELGHAFAGSGRDAEARDALRRSLALRPFDSRTLAAAARLARATGETAVADRYAGRAALTAPDCR